ncbi:hypothetical protein [Streptomyces zaomyceticus]|uniref:hypothetical protein n=1 Tax=Streptomyces zaomyceticus TaxID=68286 RepID=UPI003416A7C1
MAGEEERWHPAGQGRRVRWPESTEGWSEDRLWVLGAVRHWMLSVAHGFEGRRMRTGELARWCELKSAGTITTWIGKGGVWGASGLRYCEEARSRTDCSPECDSGYGDLAELRRRYAGALRGSDEQRKAARLQSLRRTKIPAGYVLSAKEVDRGLPALVQAQEGALRSLEAVTVNDSASGVDRVTLAEVRVERAAEAQVLKHIRRQLAGTAPGQAAALVGEPGVGKSCSLWGVHRALAGQNDICLVLLSATSLLDGGGRAADLRTRELPGLLEAYRRRTAQGATTTRRIVLLLDTADLLLHRPETVNDFVELLTVLRSRQTAVALACRAGEAGLLKERRDAERESGAYTSILADIRLGLYDDGPAADHRNGWAPGSELARAIDSYAGAYAPSRNDHDGSLPEMRQALADAAARGLPLGTLIRHPLHLRMVFDLYAPHGPSGGNLDVAGLFRDHWRWRVDHDTRHAVAPPGTDPEDQAEPLGPAAAELGLATLREGTIELRRDTSRDLVASRLAVSETRAARWIGLLLRRGVLSEPFAGRLRFHHQAIGEYAAGRGLAEAPRGLEAAVGRIAEHAQDLYLAEVARHAFHHCDRAQPHRSSRWYSLLAPLAKASSPVARETFVHILAGLRNAPTGALADIAPLIEEPDNGRVFAERYLKVLNATHEPAEGIWPPLLRTIWEAADGPGRREVLHTLTVRIRQQRSVAAAVLCALPAEELPRHALAPHLTILMRHLHEEGEAAPHAPGSGRRQRDPWDRRHGRADGGTQPSRSWTTCSTPRRDNAAHLWSTPSPPSPIWPPNGPTRTGTSVVTCRTASQECRGRYPRTLTRSSRRPRRAGLPHRPTSARPKPSTPFVHASTNWRGETCPWPVTMSYSTVWPPPSAIPESVSHPRRCAGNSRSPRPRRRTTTPGRPSPATSCVPCSWPATPPRAVRHGSGAAPGRLSTVHDGTRSRPPRRWR